MKKQLMVTMVMALTMICPMKAQVIPNNNFENWTGGVNYAPDGWKDHGSKHSGFYPAIQTSDKYLGTYAVRLENKISGIDTTPGMIETIQGNGLEGMSPSFPVNSRYTTLKGFYKYSPVGQDSGGVVVALFKTGYAHSGGFGNILAVGWKYLGVASVYTPFSTNSFMYDNGTVIPDSAYISISAFKEIDFNTGIKYPVYGNSVLIVDAINFDSYLTGVRSELKITTNFLFYPSVSPGYMNVRFETSSEEFTSIKIYDLTGREIKNMYEAQLSPGLHTYQYDFSDLSSGVYLYVIATANGYRAERFVIE